jgi:hypothetical protein
MKDLTKALRLPLAHDTLQCVAQGDQPTLAGESGQPADMIHIDHRIPVYPLELGLRHPLFDHSQALHGQKAPFPGDNPNEFPLGLKGENLVQVQQEVARTAPAHDLLAMSRDGRRNRSILFTIGHDFARLAK